MNMLKDDINYGRQLRSGLIQERLLTMKDIENGVKDCKNREFRFLTKILKKDIINQVIVIKRSRVKANQSFVQ